MNLSKNLINWLNYNWIDESFLNYLKNNKIISEEEYINILVSVEDPYEEDMLAKVVTSTTTVIA